MTRPANSEAIKGMWIAWEPHRRSRVLAAEFGLDLHELLLDAPYLIRIKILALRTWWRILRRRPGLLVVQNPSLVLAAWAAFLKPWFGFYLVVDRHSNFKLHTAQSRSLKYRIFHGLSDYSIRRADKTIVTNQFLCDLVEAKGGRGFVLPDKFPDLPLAKQRSLGPGHHVLYVCSFDDDEPVVPILAAARTLGAKFQFHVTGNFRKAGWADVVAAAPDNVTFLGFAPEEDYQSMLISCDVVLTLTTLPHIMQCGGYEAVSAATPLVFGPDPAMADYFDRGCISTTLEPEAIAAALHQAVSDGDRLTAEIQELKRFRQGQWRRQKAELLAKLPPFAAETA